MAGEALLASWADTATRRAIIDFVDAVTRGGKGRSGAARVSRFPPDVCSHPYATGLSEAQTTLFLNAAGGVIGGNQSMVPTVPAEPLVRKVFKRVPDQKREHKKHKRR